MRSLQQQVLPRLPTVLAPSLPCKFAPTTCKSHDGMSVYLLLIHAKAGSSHDLTSCACACACAHSNAPPHSCPSRCSLWCFRQHVVAHEAVVASKAAAAAEQVVAAEVNNHLLAGQAGIGLCGGGGRWGGVSGQAGRTFRDQSYHKSRSDASADWCRKGEAEGGEGSEHLSLVSTDAKESRLRHMRHHI